MMQRLNLPPCSLKMEKRDEVVTVLDIVRKRYVVLTPEEWVRQHILHYLINHKAVPINHIVIEKAFKIGRVEKRFDLAVFDRNAKPMLLIECKAPEVKIDQKVMDQALRYNMTLKVQYLLLTNGMQHIGCEADYKEKSLRYLKDLPDYNTMIANEEVV